MARLRPIKSVRVLTVEEKTRVANLFMLLIEVNLEKGITNKRRSPQFAKNKTKSCQQQPCHIKPCHIRCVNTKTPRIRKSSSPVRDLFLKPFARIFKGNIFNFIMGYSNDRYYHVNTSPGIIHYHQS